MDGPDPYEHLCFTYFFKRKTLIYATYVWSSTLLNLKKSELVIYINSNLGSLNNQLLIPSLLDLVYLCFGKSKKIYVTC